MYIIDMNRDLTPPLNIIQFHTTSVNRGECYARLKINVVVKWQKKLLLEEYGEPVDEETLELLEFSILSAWQQANFINHDPRQELKHPEYISNFLPIVLSNYKKKVFGTQKKDSKFIKFLISRALPKVA
jgi:hypothetical protein